MIKVTLYSNGLITGYDISGHSGYGEYGTDIVCSAVSALTLTAANALEQLTASAVTTRVKEGALSVRVASPDKENVQVILKSMVIGLESIVEEYGNYVEIEYKSD